MPRGYLLGLLDLSDTLAMYYTAAGILIAGYLLYVRIIHSPSAGCSAPSASIRRARCRSATTSTGSG